jgi:hypothetical protein
MKRIVRLTESDLARIVRRVINEQPSGAVAAGPKLGAVAAAVKPKPNTGAAAFQLIKKGIYVMGGTDEALIQKGVYMLKTKADYDACLAIVKKSEGWPTIMRFIATDMDYDFDRGETSGGGMDWADSNPMLTSWSNHLRKFNDKEIPQEG